MKVEGTLEGGSKDPPYTNYYTKDPPSTNYAQPDVLPQLAHL